MYESHFIWTSGKNVNMKKVLAHFLKNPILASKYKASYSNTKNSESQSLGSYQHIIRDPGVSKQFFVDTSRPDSASHPGFSCFILSHNTVDHLRPQFHPQQVCNGDLLVTPLTVEPYHGARGKNGIQEPQSIILPYFPTYITERYFMTIFSTTQLKETRDHSKKLEYSYVYVSADGVHKIYTGSAFFKSAMSPHYIYSVEDDTITAVDRIPIF